MRRLAGSLSLLLGLLLSTCCMAQDASVPPPGFRLQANSRVVLVDVSVTDAQGNPVQGLKQTDFALLDNKKVQSIATFEEHRPGSTPEPRPVALAPGVFSNDYLAHPAATINVLLLDLATISLPDQAFLRYQLDRFFDRMRPEDQVAVYVRVGRLCTLVQGFTSDTERLRAAVHKVVPHFAVLYGGVREEEVLTQVASLVGAMPGRKNVLWFSGGSAISFDPPTLFATVRNPLQPLYDLLEENRIAIYPIDVRGLMVYPSRFLLAQHALMSEEAEQTGGLAIIDNNGLALNAARIMQDNASYYTLTYSPHDFRYDNSFHHIHVELPGRYLTLSYRRGYYADPTIANELKTPETKRTRLLPGGLRKEEIISQSQPIVFAASVQRKPADPGSPPRKKRSKEPVIVHFTVPLDAFTMEPAHGRQVVHCAAAVYAFNLSGTTADARAQEVTFQLTPQAVADPAGRTLPLDVEVSLPSSVAMLQLVAWDKGNGHRIGTLEIPFDKSLLAAP